MVLAVGAGLNGPAEAAEAMDPLADPGHVVISEVGWGGTAASSADEWIELYNTTAVTVSLEGWHLVDDDSLDIALSGDIFPYGYYLIERTDDSAIEDVPADWYGSFGSGGLHNEGEVLTLTDDLDTVVDTANLDGSTWPAGSGSPDYRSMERVDPTASDIAGNWCSNDGVTRNGLDAEGNLINGTPKAQNSCYHPPVANLSVGKSGPANANTGDIVTYHIGLSNTGGLTATATILTDTLPPFVDFVTQTSPFTFSHSGHDLAWQVGDVPTDTVHRITVTARVTEAAAGSFVNRVTATTSASETATANNADAWTTTVGAPQVLIGAVLYDGYQSGDPDEAVQLVNVGTAPADLTGWELCKDVGSGLSCRACPSAVLSPTHRIWLAREAISFTTSFGFSPEYEMGSWLPYGLSNEGDEVVLRDGTGEVVDALVYGEGLTTTAGWSGPSLEIYRVGNRALEGQILYRIPDEATALPVDDTNAAADWIQSSDSITYGRRVLYPGWDLAPLFWPLSVTQPATVVVGIAPDNGFDVLSQTIVRARHTISIEVYSLRHPDVVTALVQKAREGVSVTVLLEGAQVGVGTSDPRWQQELWACQEIEAAGGECWFMIHRPDDEVFNRYDYLHAKFVVVDDEWVLITSQNLSVSSLPSDAKSNGTHGSRGVVLATDAPAVVDRAALVFALDLDPDYHEDLLRWTPTLTGTYGSPLITYTPQLSVPDATTYTVHFSTPLATSGRFGFELFTAPEAALRHSDALLGLVGRAGVGDLVEVQQLYEHLHWGGSPADDPNLRLDAYIAAARRGASVRILLNGGSFGRPAYHNTNIETVAYVNQIARAEGLDLEAAIGDPTLYGIHNKMVLVWLHDEGGYVHIGSINGSESSNKVNREMAVQVHSDQAYTYLREMFDVDWRWSRPLYLPVVMRRFVPPANHPLVSEVYYWGGCEWVEVHNPTAVTMTLAGYRLGDAQTPDRYEAMYVFPAQELAQGETLLVAGDACECTAFLPDYEMFGTCPQVPNLSRDPSWGTGEFGLGNTGDEVLLLDPAGRVVDAVVYGSGRYGGVVPNPGVGWGESLERIPAHADTDDCSQDFRAGWSPDWVVGE